MRIQINQCFILFLFLLGCGKDVNLSTAELQRQSSITTADKTNAYTNGTLTKGTTTKLTFGSKTATVSPYSSHLALEYIAALPMGAQKPVKFKGEVSDNEVVISKIEDQ